MSSPREWPGASSVHALSNGGRILGTWYDRTKQYRTCRTDGERSEEDYARVETLKLSPLPCWEGLSRAEIELGILELIVKVTQEAEEASRTSRIGPAGPRKILRQHPHRRPRTMSRSSAPLFHAATREIRLLLLRMFRQYCGLYRDAQERVRRNRIPFGFPRHGIPPPWAEEGWGD